ncbi:lysophospholipid acyltransferase family protein [Candidatus Rariloculus sp.]|uniref:lysophospholipid acyltransferase family protein n=1 Tax=Candidatus Rariloculus sp. TaxID=3101265 RepID=UPI003D0B23B0
MRQWLGSIAFTVYLFASTAIFGLVVLASAPFPHRVTYRLCLYWADSVLFLLRILCRLDHVVEGFGNLPEQNTVLLVKHSSAWEAIAQLKLFPTQTWVMKRELLLVPILGWILWLLRPIAIDRSAGRKAVRKVITEGQQRLADGLWIVIFPEGTRVPPGESRPYGLSGALLARAAGRPIVPVAHNAGEFWPRRGWLKRPGTIRVVVGPAIPTAGREPREVNAQVRAWIEARLAEMSSDI